LKEVSAEEFAISTTLAITNEPKPPENKKRAEAKQNHFCLPPQTATAEKCGQVVLTPIYLGANNICQAKK